MKTLTLLIAAATLLTHPFYAVAQDNQSTAAATATTRISAELTRKIDAKVAKVGDEVAGRLTADATLADGSMLPKGSRLLGFVAEVRAESNAEKSSHLAITFNRAIAQSGHEISLHATLRSMAAPAPMAGLGAPPDMASLGSEQRGGPALSGASAGRGHGAQGASGASGSAAGGVGAGVTQDELAGRPTKIDDPRVESAAATGDYVHDALRPHRYPVANIPGVILTSQVTASVSGALDAFGQNIRLESGTSMTMDVWSAAR